MADWIHGGKSTEEWQKNYLDELETTERITNLDDFRALVDFNPVKAFDELWQQKLNLFKTQPLGAWDASRIGPNTREWLTGKFDELQEYEATTPIKGLTAKMSEYSDADDSFEDQIKKMSFDDFVWAVQFIPDLFNISAEDWAKDWSDEKDSNKIWFGNRNPKKLKEIVRKRQLEDFKKVQEGTLKADTSFLGGFRNINELLEAQELEMQKRRIFGEAHVVDEKMSGLWGALFMDPNIKPLMQNFSEEMSRDYVEAHGLNKDGSISTNLITGDLNAVFDSHADAIKNRKFFESYMEKSLFLDTKPHYMSTGNMYGTGVSGQEIFVDPVADMISKGKMIDGKYVVKLNTYDNEFAKFARDVVSKEDWRNVLGQTIGLIDLALLPTTGVYTAILTAPYRGLKAGTTLIYKKW